MLRDADGVASDAVVEPTCFHSLSNCVLPPIGHTGPISPQCVRVIQLGDQYVDVNFDAQTGRAEDCLASYPMFAAAYPTGDCAIPGYTGGGEGTGDAFEWRRRPISLDDGTVLFEAPDSPHLDFAMGYTWNGPGDCQPIPFFSGNDLTPWLTLPASIADALPNPPYTLSWE